MIINCSEGEQYETKESTSENYCATIHLDDWPNVAYKKSLFNEMHKCAGGQGDTIFKRPSSHTPKTFKEDLTTLAKV